MEVELNVRIAETEFNDEAEEGFENAALQVKLD